MVSADTNILLRWVLNDLPDQAAAADTLLRNEDGCRIEDVAINEMVFVLEKVYGFEHQLVAGFVRSLIALGQVDCDRVLFSNALRMYEKYAQLSFADCYLAAKANQSGNRPLYTFDKQLAKKAEPAELLA